MLRSLFSGVTGLKSHQTKMDIIGNNTINANIYGFKFSRTTFRDVCYQTISSSTSVSGTRSGSNASQVGHSTSVASVDVLSTRTGYAATGNSMDLYIDGEGYFVVQDGNGNKRPTQVGTFGFDGGGNLTDGSGNFMCGYPVDKLKSTVSVGGAKVDFDLIPSIGSTKNGSYTTDGKNMSYIEGYTFKVVDGGASATEGVELDPTQETTTITLQITNMTKEELQNMLQTGTWQVTGETSTGLGFAIRDSNGNALKQADGTTDLQWADTLRLIQIKVNGAADAFTKDDVVKATTGKIAEEVTFEGGDSGSAVLGRIINNKGEMKNIAVGMDGMVTGEDADGTIQIVGKIAVANIPNLDVLQHEGNSYYKVVNSTGVITYITPGESNTGVLRSGGFEMSNVDLTNEFSDMIITQRGSQTNSKVTIVSDEMLETLVNLKR